MIQEIAKWSLILIITGTFVNLLAFNSLLPAQLSFFTLSDFQTVLNAVSSLFNITIGFTSPFVNWSLIFNLIQYSFAIMLFGFTYKVVEWIAKRWENL